MKFGVVGGFAYLVDISLFNLLLHTTDKPLTSKAISTVVATTVSVAGTVVETGVSVAGSAIRGVANAISDKDPKEEKK